MSSSLNWRDGTIDVTDVGGALIALKAWLCNEITNGGDQTPAYLQDTFDYYLHGLGATSVPDADAFMGILQRLGAWEIDTYHDGVLSIKLEGGDWTGLETGYLSAIAPFCADGCYLELESDDYQPFRWTIYNGAVWITEPVVSWPEPWHM